MLRPIGWLFVRLFTYVRHQFRLQLEQYIPPLVLNSLDFLIAETINNNQKWPFRKIFPDSFWLRWPLQNVALLIRTRFSRAIFLRAFGFRSHWTRFITSRASKSVPSTGGNGNDMRACEYRMIKMIFGNRIDVCTASSYWNRFYDFARNSAQQESIILENAYQLSAETRRSERDREREKKKSIDWNSYLMKQQ